MNYAIATPNIYAAFTASSPTDLYNKLIAYFTAVGWSLVGPTTGGVTLKASSPELLTVYLNLFLGAGDGQVYLQLASAIGSGASGVAHRLYNLGNWQIAVHRCGYFISQPGVAGDARGSSASGGIPYLGSDCGVSMVAVTEVWFSFGDFTGDPFTTGANPRLGIDIAEGYASQYCSGCYNGAMAFWNTGSAWDHPQILRFSSAAPDSPFSTADDSHPLWYGETAMTYPAFVAWPSTLGAPVQIRGQLYNAFVASQQTAMDLVQTLDGYEWINYTAAYFWGTLWLLIKPLTGSLANVVY